MDVNGVGCESVGWIEVAHVARFVKYIIQASTGYLKLEAPSTSFLILSLI
jgi:hypothetical protein